MAATRQPPTLAEESEVVVQTGDLALPGTLAIPPGAQGVVAFAHGSGSSRKSPRNRFVAAVLWEEAGAGTLLFDLLSREEEAIDRRTAHLRFDIGLLARRLVAAVDWLGGREATQGLPVGLFGASTGGAAALVAAAARPRAVGAVVSRGGRPDLAGHALEQVQAPTLLLVGGADPQVLALNRAACERLPGEKELHVVAGAGHLFEEPGTLEEVARRAADWFRQHLTGRATA